MRLRYSYQKVKSQPDTLIKFILIEKTYNYLNYL